jgi:nucleoid-associated protein YgaU
MSFRHAFRNDSSDNAHRGTSRTQRRLRAATVAGIVVAAPLVGLATANSASAASDSQWDRVAQCESGGKWNTNTGNGYYGGLQFTPSTWRANGGSGSPQNASKSEQIRVAENVLKTQGKGAWPVCGKGLTSGGSNSAAKSAPKESTSKSSKSTTTKQNAAPKSQTPKQAPKTAKPAAPKQSADKTPAPAAPSTSAEGTYTVKSGDTLSGIAAKLGTAGGWQGLFAKNKSVIGSNPNMILPGQQLVLR